MAVDRNGNTLAVGDKGTWQGHEGEFKVASIMELGANSRIEVHREGEANKRDQIPAASFTKAEDKSADDTEVEVPPPA